MPAVVVVSRSEVVGWLFTPLVALFTWLIFGLVGATATPLAVQESVAYWLGVFKATAFGAVRVQPVTGATAPKVIDVLAPVPGLGTVTPNADMSKVVDV